MTVKIKRPSKRLEEIRIKPLVRSPRATEVMNALAAFNSEAKPASDPAFEVMVQQTGVLPLDVLLYGGLAKGRFTLFTGQFSTLKSYMALRAIAACQQAGGLAALIDTEKSFDPVWATHLGVNIQDLIVMQPVVGEDALGVCEALLQQHGLDLLVWDSLASTLTTEQSEKRAGETDKVATLARFINRGLLRINAVNEHCAIMLINQVRTKIGVTFGSPDSYPGGNAQMFYSAQHVIMRRGERIKEDHKQHRLGVAKTAKRTTHQVYEAELAKSKVGGAPFRSATILWDPHAAAVDELAFAIDAGLDLNLVGTNSTGSMYTYGNVTGAKGKRFYDKLAASGEGQQLMHDVLFAACPRLGLPK